MFEEIQRFQPKTDDIVHSASNDIIYSTFYNIIHFASNTGYKMLHESLALLQKIKLPFDSLC